MDPRDTRVTVGVTYHCLNKTRLPKEQENWTNVQLLLGELYDTVIRKGAAFCTSLFKGGYRKGDNAFGGDTIVIDEDEGLDPAVIAELPVFKEYGIAIWPSASSGVAADKKDVDGRYRSRVLLKVGRQFKTGDVKDDAVLERTAIHAERIAVSEYIYERFCKEAGIEELKDTCGKTVGQLMYGNDGQTPIEYTKDDGSKGTYPCSTHSWVYFNNGCMPVEQMEKVVADFYEQQPERLKPKQRRSDEENAEDYQLALWILEQDILSEDVLTDRKSWTDIGMACRGIDDDLHDAFLETTSRFSDGHYWREWGYMSDNWQRFGTTSSFGIGTLIHFADKSTDQKWRYTCPYWGSKTQKQFISSCYQLLKSHKPGTPGFNNFQLRDF